MSAKYILALFVLLKDEPFLDLGISFNVETGINFRVYLQDLIPKTSGQPRSNDTPDKKKSSILLPLFNLF